MFTFMLWPAERAREDIDDALQQNVDRGSILIKANGIQSRTAH
jgi:hypothetical protein